MNMIKRLWKEEEGQALSEYGLVIGLVIVMGVAAFTAFNPAIVDFFKGLVANLTTSTTP